RETEDLAQERHFPGQAEADASRGQHRRNQEWEVHIPDSLDELRLVRTSHRRELLIEVLEGVSHVHTDVGRDDETDDEHDGEIAQAEHDETQEDDYECRSEHRGVEDSSRVITDDG